MSVRTK